MLEFLNIFSCLFQTGYIDNESAFPEPLSKEQEYEYLVKYWNGDMQAREELIKHNLRLVVHIVKKYNNYNDIEELISVGAIGLIKAIGSYAEGKGTRLATYAVRCIENEILMVLRANKKRSNDKSLYDPVSFDKEGNEVSLIDLMSTDDDSVMKRVENDILTEKINSILHKVLTDRECEILILRYGLADTPQYTQIEVAKMFKISRSYVSRIEKKAMEKVRDYLVENDLL